MKNTKMKYKTFFLIMLLLTLLNNASGYEVYEGEVFSSAYSQTNENIGYSATGSYTFDTIGIVDGGTAKDLKSVSVMIYINAWEGSQDYAYIKQDVVYKQGGVEKGTGYMYYWLQSTDEDPEYERAYIKCHFDEGLNLGSGVQMVDIVGDITSLSLFDRRTQFTVGGQAQKQCYLGDRHLSGNAINAVEGYHSANHEITFYNNYSYWYNEDLFTFELTRNASNPSMLYINNRDTYDLINETSYNNVITSVYSDAIDYDIWDIEIYDINTVTHAFQIDFIPEIEDLTPTLTTDKSLYNTSELLTISYTNIDEMDIHGTPALFIVYPIIDDYHDYDAKFMQHLLSSKEDETFTINTSILQPQTEYYLVIADNTDWSRIESAYITSDVFYVYPDEEYLTTSCTVEGNCYTYNGDYISIYYKVNNNSDIIIKDNDNNIIQTYYNIINEGKINYQIPFDENKLNSYPNWKVYLNNTEYETNYSTDVTVYWSLFVTPTPTPVYTVDIPDENVTEQIDQLKEESKPIFDLIYGLTTLVIDNPDYDNDNIIDEHEINNWFNSLIPLGILLLLVILYMGLKKRD